jgi:hypothetical protein
MGRGKERSVLSLSSEMAVRSPEMVVAGNEGEELGLKMSC